MAKISIRAAIANTNKSQEEFAKEVEVSPRTVWNWVNGKTKPKNIYLMGIAYACGISVDDLDFDMS